MVAPAWDGSLAGRFAPLEPLRLHRCMWALSETLLHLWSGAPRFSTFLAPSFQPE